FCFLITIISPNFDHDGHGDKKEFNKLYKAAQSTLISYAFFPENKHFYGIKLHEQTITYPPFVISIPIFWSKKFEQKYKVLKKYYGVEQVVVEKRKILTHYIHYTVLCRGTLESCQKLESKLTPFIEMHETKSMKETKSWKGKVMQNLLSRIFGFKHNNIQQQKNCHQKSGSRAYLK
uniref:Uncharacterized protein n=1 Tax=Panagrolaimus sp. PS1159 TaxID=55785 RepID=A0AC35F275_9BILA